MDAATLPAGLAELYEVQGVLGRGGMGVVYRARHRRLDRAVALKLLLGWLDDPDLHDRFRREARLLAELAHPGVVRLLDADVAGDTPYIAMELLEGEVLSSVLADGPMEPGAARALVLALLDAIGHVHAAGLLHRDLKPSNIFMRDGARPVLIDFGLARKAGATLLTQPGSLIGTPKYFSPEIVRGEEHTVSSDLFAVAMTGVDALTLQDVHRVAGKADRMIAICRSLTSGAYHPVAVALLAPFGVPGEVLAKALHPDPAQRFASAEAMAAALAAPAGSGRVARAGRVLKPSVSVSVPPPDAPRRGALAALAGVALLAVAAGLAHREAPSRSSSPASPASPTSPPGPAETPEALMHALLGAAKELEALARDALRHYDEELELTAADPAAKRAARAAFVRRHKDFAQLVGAGREQLLIARRSGRALLARRLPVELELRVALALYASLDEAAKLGAAGEQDLERLPAEWASGLGEDAARHFLRGMVARFRDAPAERCAHMEQALAALDARLPAAASHEQLRAFLAVVSELVDAARHLPSRRARVRAAFARLKDRRRSAPPAAVDADMAAQIARLDDLLQRP